MAQTTPESGAIVIWKGERTRVWALWTRVKNNGFDLIQSSTLCTSKLEVKPWGTMQPDRASVHVKHRTYMGSSHHVSCSPPCDGPSMVSSK